jgi:hypothetical protein
MQPYHLPVVAEDAEINPVLLRVAVHRGQLCDGESYYSRAVENHFAVGVFAKIDEPTELLSVRQVLIHTVTSSVTPRFQENVGSAMSNVAGAKGG